MNEALAHPDSLGDAVGLERAKHLIDLIRESRHMPNASEPSRGFPDGHVMECPLPGTAG